MSFHKYTILIFINISLFICNHIIAQTFGPYLGDASLNEITIVWRTDTPSSSIVEWSTGENKSILDKILENETNVTQHELRITNLQPGKEHTYRVLSKVGDTTIFESNAHTFRSAAPPGKDFRFVFLAEVHNDEDVEAFNDEIDAFDPWFQIQPGDNIDDANNIDDFKKFFTQGDWYHRLPIFNSLGNHNYISEIKKHIPTNTNAVMSLELFPPHKRYYTFKYGDVQFFALDSEHYLSDDVRNDEPAWFENVLIDATDGIDDPEIMIAFFHIPPFSSCGENSCRIRRIIEKPWVKRELVSRIEKYGVDLVLVGHDRITEYTINNGVHYIQVTSGKSPRKSGAFNLNSQFLDTENRSIMLANVAGCNLTFDLVGTDGTILYSSQIIGNCIPNKDD